MTKKRFLLLTLSLFLIFNNTVFAQEPKSFAEAWFMADENSRLYYAAGFLDGYISVCSSGVQNKSEAFACLGEIPVSMDKIAEMADKASLAIDDAYKNDANKNIPFGHMMRCYTDSLTLAKTTGETQDVAFKKLLSMTAVLYK